MSEYLAEDLSKKLAQHLNISDEVENKKRKLTSPRNETDEKKLKKDSFEEIPVPKAKKQTKDLNKPEKVSHISKNNNYSHIFQYMNTNEIYQ